MLYKWSLGRNTCPASRRGEDTALNGGDAFFAPVSNRQKQTFSKEDARRTPWCRVPKAVYALSHLRMIALNVVAVPRASSRAEFELAWSMVVDFMYGAWSIPNPIGQTGCDGRVT